MASGSSRTKGIPFRWPAPSANGRRWEAGVKVEAFCHLICYPAGRPECHGSPPLGDDDAVRISTVVM
jgi:hypothetical protein